MSFQGVQTKVSMSDSWEPASGARMVDKPGAYTILHTYGGSRQAPGTWRELRRGCEAVEPARTILVNALSDLSLNLDSWGLRAVARSIL